MDLSPSAQELIDRLQRTFRRAKQIAWWHAIAVSLTVILGSLLVLAMFDLLFRWSEAGMRWLAWTLWVSISFATLVYWLRRAARFSPTLPEVARQIERRFPGVKDQLSTAVSLALHADSDFRFGSNALRERAIENGIKLASTLPIQNCLNRTPALRISLALLAIAALIATGLLIQPQLSTLALRRLAFPWDQTRWPQRNQLEFDRLPNIVAAGTNLEVRIVDRQSRLPKDLTLFVKKNPAAGNLSEEAIPVQETADGAVAILGSIRDSIQLRATGGDDRNMPWREVRVVDPPRLESYEFEITPPAYTGQPPSRLVGMSIRALHDSRVVLQGTISQSISSIRIASWDVAKSAVTAPASDKATSEEAAVKPKMELTNGGKSFRFVDPVDSSIGWKAISTVRFRLSWTSTEGLEATSDEFSIQVNDDRVPSVQLIEPKADLAMTASATIPLQAQVSDDLGLASVVLRYRTVNADLVDQPAGDSLWTQVDGEPPTKGREVSKSWIPSAVLALDSKKEIEFWIEATDTRGQIGSSTHRRLRIQSEESMLQQLAERQANVLPRIEQALSLLEQAALPVESTLEVLEQTGDLQQADRDALQSAQRSQRSADNQLAQAGDSALSELQEIQSQLRDNRMENSPLGEQSREMIESLKKIHEGALNSAQKSLQTANSIAKDTERADKKSLAENLERTRAAQREAAQGIRQMVDAFAQQDSMQQSIKQLQQVLNSQMDLQNRTAELQQSELVDAQASESAAERVRLATSQRELARNLDQLSQRLTQQPSATANESSDFASNLERLREALQSNPQSEAMRDTASKISADQLAEALDQQQSIRSSLQSMLDQVMPRAGSSLQDLTDRLKEAESQAASTAAAQSSLADAVAGLNPTDLEKAQALEKQQAQLRNQTEQLIDAVKEQLNGRWDDRLNDAAANQANTEQALQQQQWDQAQQSSQRSAEQLKEVSKQIQQSVRELEQQVLLSKLHELEAVVSRLISEQSTILGDAESLQKAITEGQLPDLSQTQVLAARQLASRQLLSKWPAALAELPAYPLVIQAALDDMDQAVAGFERADLETSGLPSARSVAKRLESLKESFAKNQPKNPDAAQETNNENQDTQRNSSRSPSLASLKLLRAMQQDLLQETESLEAEKQAGDLSPTKTARLSQIAKLQRQLADQVEEIAREMRESSTTP